MLQSKTRGGVPAELKASEEQVYLRHMARHLTSNEADAEDLVQEIWIEALERPPERFRHFRGWARVVARRTVARKRRAERSRRERELRVARLAVAPSAYEAAARSDLRAGLEALVGDLRPPYREVIAMRYGDELSIEEIGTRLGRTPGTVRCQLKRGLDRVRLRVKDTQRIGCALRV